MISAIFIFTALDTIKADVSLSNTMLVAKQRHQICYAKNYVCTNRPYYGNGMHQPQKEDTVRVQASYPCTVPKSSPRSLCTQARRPTIPKYPTEDPYDRKKEEEGAKRVNCPGGCTDETRDRVDRHPADRPVNVDF